MKRKSNSFTPSANLFPAAELVLDVHSALSMWEVQATKVDISFKKAE